VAVRPGHGNTYRHAVGFGQRAAFDSPLAPVGRVLATPLPRPNSTSPSPSLSTRRGVPTPPAIEAWVSYRTRTHPRFIRRLPLTTGAQHNIDAVGTLPIRHLRASVAEGMRIDMSGNQRLPQVIGHGGNRRSALRCIVCAG
jgi:hypothetical protein